MNRTTTMILSLLLASSATIAAPQSQEPQGSELSIDQIKFNLDWDDKQFGWSQSDCLDLGVGDSVPSDCNTTRFNLEDEENRNQPPSTNQAPANQQGGQ